MITRIVIAVLWYVEHIMGPLTPTVLGVIIRGHSAGWSIRCVNSSDLSISIALLALLVLVVSYPHVRTVHGKKKARPFLKTYALVIGISLTLFVLATVDEVTYWAHAEVARNQLEKGVTIVELLIGPGRSGAEEAQAFTAMASSTISKYDETGRKLDSLRIWVFVLGVAVIGSTAFLRQRYKITE